MCTNESGERGNVSEILRQLFPKSEVLKMYGSRSSSSCRSAARYAVPASKCEGSMFTIFAQAESFGMLADTSVQCAPPSVLTFTRPSFDPAQCTPARTGVSASATWVVQSDV